MALWCFHMLPESHWKCGPCGSRRDESQLRLGLSRDLSIPLTPESVEIEETDAARGLLGPGHAHAWKFAQGTDGGGPLVFGVI